MKMLVVGRLSLACAATSRFPLHFTCATIAIPAKICLHTQPTTPFGLSIRACCNPSSPASPSSLPYPPPPVPPPLSSSSSSSSTSSSSSSFSAQIPCPPDYLSLSDKELFLQCNMDTYRASGPGGQHRNKTESAVRLTHLPTGLVSQAADDRSQHKNRAYALERLRTLIAVKVRRPVELDKYSPPAELTRILPAGKGQKSGGQKIGPNHSDFSKGVQCLLDLLLATEGSVSAAATKLGISTGALSKVITSDKSILLPANELRAFKGLKPLR